MHVTLQTESRVALAYSVFKISYRLLHSMAAFESDSQSGKRSLHVNLPQNCTSYHVQSRSYTLLSYIFK